jgi:hypothetical protein
LANPRRAVASPATSLCSGDSEKEEEAALAAVGPLALPPIATALARLEQMLTDLAR